MRPSHRLPSELRDIVITRQFIQHAEGSVLVEYGNTKVICTASIQEGVPPFLKGSKTGWLTAEYGMLPRSTADRMKRESSIGKQSGRTQEIQRLIGRSLRTCIDFSALHENTIYIDCDVIQADGGTRTASITGACVALYDAAHYLLEQKRVKKNPMKFLVAAVSVGMYQGQPVLDLDYKEDSHAETDMNVVMSEHGNFIEIQGTAEQAAFSRKELDSMLDLAETGAKMLIEIQRKVLGLSVEI